MNRSTKGNWGKVEVRLTGPDWDWFVKKREQRQEKSAVILRELVNKARREEQNGNY